MNTNARVLMVLATLAVLLTAGQALAGNSWLCSITYAVGCDEDGTIGDPYLGGLETPTFLRVDADKKKVTLLAPESRQGEVTKIDAVFQDEDLWVFSGVEEGRAWSLVISGGGYMTMSVTMDGATWSVFGNALSED